jgi:transcriptional regulator with XRE-family HTH domain
MANKPGDSNFYLTARGLFAKETTRLRETADLSLAQLGELASCDKTYLWRIEQGEKFPKEAIAQALDKALNAGGLLTRLWRLATSGTARDDYGRYRELQPRAIKMQQYQSAYIPGLLQTEEYARTLINEGHPFGPPERVESLVVARLARQQWLQRENPPVFWVVLDEAALRRQVGGPAAMARQLSHLVEAAQKPNIFVQVLPFTAGAHPMMGSSMTIMSFPNDADAAFLEGTYRTTSVAAREEILFYTLQYDLARVRALTPEDSLDFIRKIVEDFERCTEPNPT